MLKSKGLKQNKMNEVQRPTTEELPAPTSKLEQNLGKDAQFMILFLKKQDKISRGELEELQKIAQENPNEVFEMLNAKGIDLEAERKAQGGLSESERFNIEHGPWAEGKAKDATRMMNDLFNKGALSDESSETMKDLIKVNPAKAIRIAVAFQKILEEFPKMVEDGSINFARHSDLEEIKERLRHNPYKAPAFLRSIWRDREEWQKMGDTEQADALLKEIEEIERSTVELKKFRTKLGEEESE